jgi:aminoglycoside phosphotransferase (APT) family kinase protein
VPEALTVERAGELFADLLPGRGPVSTLVRFAEGSVTGAYRVEFADAAAPPVVLKVYGTGGQSAGKEARALRFLTGHGIDISPRVLAYRGSVDALGGRPCLVSTVRPGRTLSAVDDELTCAQRYEVYRQLGQVLGRLHAIPAGGYGDVDGTSDQDGEICDPLPDNGAHMTRLLERDLGAFRVDAGDPVLADRIAEHVTEHASAFDECRRPAYCHGDVHEPNLLVEPGEDGACPLTGLLDPENMHAGDPLMEFARLDAFSLDGDATKIAGLLSGYGVSGSGRHGQAGQWPEAWRSRLPLYRIALALELHAWFTISGETRRLPALERELRQLVD